MRKILLVEDCRADEQTLRTMLKDDGEVLVVRSVDECCRAVADDDFDVVLLDLGLTNGELCRAVHRVRLADQAIPLVALTTHRDREGGSAALCHGANEYVEKNGMDSHQLLIKIDQAITRASNSSIDLIRDLKAIRHNVSAADRTLAEAEAQFSPAIRLK